MSETRTNLPGFDSENDPREHPMHTTVPTYRRRFVGALAAGACALAPLAVLASTSPADAAATVTRQARRTGTTTAR